MPPATMSSGTRVECNSRLREIRAVREDLDALAKDMQQVETKGASLLQSVGSQARASACNLLRYLALRRRDLRNLSAFGA